MCDCEYTETKNKLIKMSNSFDFMSKYLFGQRSASIFDGFLRNYYLCIKAMPIEHEQIKRMLKRPAPLTQHIKTISKG